MNAIQQENNAQAAEVLVILAAMTDAAEVGKWLECVDGRTTLILWLRKVVSVVESQKPPNVRDAIALGLKQKDFS